MREIRTSRSVGAPGGRPHGATRREISTRLQYCIIVIQLMPYEVSNHQQIRHTIVVHPSRRVVLLSGVELPVGSQHSA